MNIVCLNGKDIEDRDYGNEVLEWPIHLVESVGRSG